MSQQVCSRCLIRTSKSGASYTAGSSTAPNASIRFPSRPTNSFSTSASLFALPPKKKSNKNFVVRDPKRGEKTTFAPKKNKKSDGSDGSNRGKRPAIGERKALRKRVLLSNTNALEVTGMEDLSLESSLDPESVGKVVGIPRALEDRLREVQAFKPSQGWGLFSRPAMVVRRETVEHGRLMENIAKEKRVVRRVLVGERMTGKSAMVLQAIAMAMMRKWVVINIPEAMDLTIAQTEYAPYPTPTSDPLQYTQPAYTASLLLAISHVNPILQTIQISNQPDRTQGSSVPSVPTNISLARLCQIGAESPASAWPIFQLLLSELKQPNRPPLLFALDGLGFAMRETKYIDGKAYKPIHAHSFTLISEFLSHLSGTSPLPNGGMVIAAVSESNRPHVEALNLALEQIESNGEVARDPFKKYDERVMGVFQDPAGKGRGVEVQRLGGLGKVECRALMEYWAKSGIVKGRVGVTEVAEKWGIAGGGVVGELERACFRRMA